VSGFLFDRVEAVLPTAIGLLLTAWGTWGLHTLSPQTSFREIQILMVIRGLGMGLAMMPVTTAGMSVIPRHQVGEASAISNVCRQIFASFGIALLTSIFQQRLTFHAVRLAEGVCISSPVTFNILQQLAAYLGSEADNQRAIGILYSFIQSQAFALAIDDAFAVATFFVVIAIPLIFFFPSQRSPGEYAHQARRDKPQKAQAG